LVQTDITERKHAESELMRSEERFRHVAETVSDFIWEVDANGLYTYTSPSVKKILGYRADELIGKMHFYDLFSPDVREELKAAAFQMFSAKQPFKAFPNPTVSKDGKIVHMETSGIPVLDEAGNLTCYRGADTDVTKRKQADEEIKKAYEEIKNLKDRLEAENIYLRKNISLSQEVPTIIGQSDPIKYVHYRINQVASLDTTVLIVGETGTGKGLVARAVHEGSVRKDHPMIHVNCAVLPANLIESELFGREKGAFTGAQAKQIGRFELAHKGTIFLDEIAELPVELQAKLLRVVENGEFERLGDPHTVKVDVRIIASTNRNLHEEIRNGRFREDLFYRLNVFPITVPPLRQRIEDIPLIVDALIDRLNKQMGRHISTVPQEVMRALQSYSWPGNVRELENVVERAVIMSRGPVLQFAEQLSAVPAPVEMVRDTAPTGLADMERSHIQRTLVELKWKIEGKAGAAHVLGLKPSTLRTRMKKLNIHRPEPS
jgi:formate hydrogenlyase transcriptional activator